jgi:hypothetical protein
LSKEENILKATRSEEEPHGQTCKRYSVLQTEQALTGAATVSEKVFYRGKDRQVMSPIQALGAVSFVCLQEHQPFFPVYRGHSWGIHSRGWGRPQEPQPGEDSLEAPQEAEEAFRPAARPVHRGGLGFFRRCHPTLATQRKMSEIKAIPSFINLFFSDEKREC